MSDKKTREEVEEQASFEAVDQASDLEPEVGVGKALGAYHRDLPHGGKVDAMGKDVPQTMVDPDFAGHYEQEGARAGGLAMPLHLGGKIRQDGGRAVTEYQGAYNQYAQPLRKTYRAMGRLKDVSMTGAPLTPAELQKDPKLASKFSGLAAHSQKNFAGHEALTNWAQAQTRMQTNILAFGSGQHLLGGAMAAYSAVKTQLEIRKTEAVKASKEEEIRKIDEDVKTIHEIMDVTVEAWSAAGELDEVFGSADLNESVEGPEVIDKNPTNGPTLYDVGTVDDPTGENAKVGTKGSTRATKLDAVAQGAKDSKKIIANAKKHLAAAGKFDLTIDGVLTAVMGGKKYVELQKQVAHLSARIQELGLTKEAQQMDAATDALQGFKMQLQAEQKQLKDDRVAARQDASLFAEAQNSANEGVMTMYAAEAYTELVEYGEVAARQRQDIVPMAAAAREYAYSETDMRFRGKGVWGDVRSLRANLDDFSAQGEYFSQHLPEWQRNAAEWSSFFTQQTHIDLVRTDNAADDLERENPKSRGKKH
jgi:hypothetical protein